MSKQLELAEAQLTGYDHASRGYSVRDLATSMGLKKSEWIKLRDQVQLKESDKDDLDERFNIKTN